MGEGLVKETSEAEGAVRSYFVVGKYFGYSPSPSLVSEPPRSLKGSEELGKKEESWEGGRENGNSKGLGVSVEVPG